MRNLPNILTVGRLLSLPFLVALMMIDATWAAWTSLGLYTLGCITDWFDGYLARKFKLESPFGKFLDPVADKIFVATVLLTLLANGHVSGWGIAPIILILSREFLISGLREYFGPKNIQFPVSKLAKWKTTIQMFSLGFLIMGEYGVPVLPLNIEIGYTLLVAATVLTIMTGWSYFKEGMKHLND
ncbi:MAG TPA: CDP-diacylglycerol--glycerol-3-phosphate 3-phosphatidyltransferase [Alphaproteobacteria bacterium]|nr:CDP-diacylglycerol--glycerol-3-phosphate 3-phosphatidyltransferase [Alphaproteobacteria bacterium]HNS44310.1 CDP-diacylglycerol--glycerol-3-phosphate 3-phosphatidyltransferase [Alphaproteobacteria bacterium]